MHHNVAVHTSTASSTRTRIIHRACNCRWCKPALDARNYAGKRCLAVVRAVMAFVTQERSSRFQQRSNVGTVRRMAIGAVFCHRLVFPQEWAALFSMAGETGFSHCGFLQQLGSGRTVRIVAVRTDDLARIDRVRRYLVGISALLLVTSEAHFGLSFSVAYLIYWRMHLVAIVTRNLVVLVLTTIPVGTIGALVATYALTGTNLVIRHSKRTLFENNIRSCTSFDVGITVQVLFAFAVAGLAVRRAGIAPDAVFALIKGENR